MERRNPPLGKEFIKLYADSEPLMNELTPILVCSPANTFTIWDSRVIHCNTTGLHWDRLPTNSNDFFHRLCVYVSMCPANTCTKADAQRVQYYLQGSTLNHSPSIMNEKAPMGHSTLSKIRPTKDNPSVNPIPLNPNQLSLLSSPKYLENIPKRFKLKNDEKSKEKSN